MPFHLPFLPAPTPLQPPTILDAPMSDGEEEEQQHQHQHQHQQHQQHQHQQHQQLPSFHKRCVQYWAAVALVITVLTLAFFILSGGRCCNSSSSSSSSSASTTSTSTSPTSNGTRIKTMATTPTKSVNGDKSRWSEMQAPSFVSNEEEETTRSPSIPPVGARVPSLHQIVAEVAALTTGKSAAWVEGEEDEEDEEDEERRGEAERVCFVDNAVELREAVEHKSCSLVQLAARSDGVGEDEQEQVGGWVGGREGGRE